MSPARTVRQFVSDTPEYHHAFKTFLTHTDQKEKALAWLAAEVDALPNRRRMIDAGAGTGKLTALFVERFAEVVAIEPNLSLVDELKATCPTAHVIAAGITESEVPGDADFVLCSHVFYYIPNADRPATLSTMLGWLSPGGVFAAAVQNPNSDGMKMVQHFHGRRVNLSELVPLARAKFDAVRVETVPASVVAPYRETACLVAEFVLNVFPFRSPIPWADLEAYADAHFRKADGRYVMSCDQDFLRVERPVS